MKFYKDYKPGLNCKGLRLKTVDENPVVTTERGARRKERGPNVHVHSFVLWSPPANTSYHSARITNEARYYCKVSRQAGGGCHRGGSKRTGCGHSCRNPK